MIADWTLRSVLEIDRSALRWNVRRMRRALGASDLWAVVKANGYGHGAVLVGTVALEEGATALCVATVGEALELRASLPEARVIVLCPVLAAEVATAREARLELVVSDGPVPEGVPVHLKLDTGMGRWGVASVASTAPNVVGLMSHLATADTDAAFAERQIARFLEIAAACPGIPRSLANSAGILRFPHARLEAGRAGIALYGLSPFGVDPADDDLRPVLRWRSVLAQVKLLQPGESTGYNRRFVATRPTWIGIVPVGYADGFRRGLTGTEVLVDGERRPVVGTVSMDSFAVALERELPAGTPVTLVGDGILAEEHARLLDTITYEVATGLCVLPTRCRRTTIGA